MLFRGKDFDGIAALTNAEEIKLSLLGNDSLNENVPYKQRKLKFEIQMKERELERMESSGADDSAMSDNRIDHLREAVKKLSAELQQLGKSIGKQSIPQVDYLKTCYDFYIQRNLYHLSDIDFSDCMKNIPFYDLKHFFQSVIKEIYADSEKITAIEFRTEQEKDKIHIFS